MNHIIWHKFEQYIGTLCSSYLKYERLSELNTYASKTMYQDIYETLFSTYNRTLASCNIHNVEKMEGWVVEDMQIWHMGGMRVFHSQSHGWEIKRVYTFKSFFWFERVDIALVLSPRLVWAYEK